LIKIDVLIWKKFPKNAFKRKKGAFSSAFTLTGDRFSGLL